MKHCRKCDTSKPASEFYKNRTKKDGLQTTCKSCCNGNSKSHYHRNVDQYLRKNVLNKEKNRALVRKLKGSPCTDCGIEYPYYVMDFDHLSDKDFNISSGTYTTATNVLRRELAKCEVVCSNCHRERSFRRLSALGEMEITTGYEPVIPSSTLGERA